MEKHPLPQNVSSYEFRLVGEMTLKQFFMLAGGAIVAFLLYTTHLPGLFKWPLIVGSASLGAAFAFVPINDQPLSRWMIIFFRSVFSPTMLFWQKKTHALQSASTTMPATGAIKSPDDEQISGQRIEAGRQKLSDFLQTLPFRKPDETTPEEEKVSSVTNLFSSIPTPSFAKPPQTTPNPPTPVSISPEPVAETISAVKPAPFFSPPTSATPTTSDAPYSFPVKRPVGRPRKPPLPALTNENLPIPKPPESPNLLVGMVMDKDGNLIEGAILEIKNSQGLPVRALRTNKIGQFRTATPLADGEYEIETDKEGYSFAIIKLNIEGKIVKPIEIRSF